MRLQIPPVDERHLDESLDLFLDNLKRLIERNDRDAIGDLVSP